MRQILSIILAAAWIAADYFSKVWAVQELTHQTIQLTSWFNLRLTYNPGAAFSFLGGQGGWQRWLFAGLAIVVALWLLYSLLFDRLNGLTRLGYAGIMGGALGNLYDRLIHGKVIDFIQWHYQEHYWPIFNIADVAITTGVAFVILGMLLNKPKAGKYY